MKATASLGVAALLAVLVAGATLLPLRGGAQDDDEAVATPAKNDPLAPVSAALRADDYPKAKELLKALEPQRNTIDGRRWFRLASLVALRTGDGAWLKKLSEDPSAPDSTGENLTVAASRLLMEGRIKEAKGIIAQIPDPEHQSEIPRRRYRQLQMRIAQLGGDAPTERKYATEMVDMVGEWDSDTCQGCHASPKRYGEKITTFDATNWWVGHRYTELVKADAPAVIAEAQAKLATNPKDGAAILRLGYALRSQGKAAESETVLKRLTWAEFPGREKRTPARLSQFP